LKEKRRGRRAAAVFMARMLPRPPSREYVL
jgi:hypothetical protein